MKNEKDTALQRVEAGADELAVSCSPEQTGGKKKRPQTLLHGYVSDGRNIVAATEQRRLCSRMI